MHGLPQRVWGREDDKSFGLGRRERSYQTEVRNMLRRFFGTVAHHRLIPMLRATEHAANPGAGRRFASHAASEQRQRHRQKSNDNDGNFGALHLCEPTTAMLQTRMRYDYTSFVGFASAEGSR